MKSNENMDTDIRDIRVNTRLDLIESAAYGILYQVQILRQSDVTMQHEGELYALRYFTNEIGQFLDEIEEMGGCDGLS